MTGRYPFHAHCHRAASYIVGLFFLLTAHAAIAAQTPSHVEGHDIFYYYDANSALNVDSFRTDIEEPGRYSNFAQASIPMGRGNHWVFFKVDQRTNPPGDPLLLEINFPNIDEVAAVIVYDNAKQERFLTGDEVAFHKWPVAYRKPSLPLTFVSESNATVYLQVKSETPLILPMRLVASSEQVKTQLVENFIYGLFYGAIIILAIYNGAVYFSLRDTSYRYYILYILAFSLVQASTTGLGQYYLWPSLSGATTRIALLSIIFTHYFMVQFVIYFLDLPRHRPALVKPLRWTAYLAVLLAPTLALPQYAYTQFAIHSVNVLGMLAILTATGAVIKHNPRPAIYLLISYSILFSAIVLALLFQANLIEQHPYIDFTMSAAILIEAFVLSVGLSDRIAQLRNENEKSEREHRMVQEQLSQQLITAREQERSEISRLLHDSVNHDLVVIRSKLGQLRRNDTPETLALSEDVNEIDELLSKAIGEVRNISHLKHPQMVKHLGLQTALEALVANTFDDTTTVNIHIEDIPLPYDVQLFVYRTVQESTTNIIKHAGATECIVRLYRDGSAQQVHFLIRDDGDGFDAEGRNWRFGLRTLNEYCKSLGGTFQVSSSPGQGTTVRVTFSNYDDKPTGG